MSSALSSYSSAQVISCNNSQKKSRLHIVAQHFKKDLEVSYVKICRSQDYHGLWLLSIRMLIHCSNQRPALGGKQRLALYLHLSSSVLPERALSKEM